MAQNLGIIIVEKTGTVKTLNIKDYKEDELYKKCGFKKPDHFSKQTEWNVKIDGSRYIVALHAKTEGKANTENKYDFPPPVDSTLYFGSCALTCVQIREDKSTILFTLTTPLWEKVYEKLFGGFEDLSATCAEDEAEIDELDNIPDEKKTKQGYLKDGFVVDSDTEDNSASDEESEDLMDSDETEETEIEGLELEDIGSELSEDEYEYSEDESK